MDSSTSGNWNRQPTRTKTKSCFAMNATSGAYQAYMSDEVVERECLTGYRGKRIPGHLHPCIHTKEKWVGVRSPLSWNGTSYIVQDVPSGVCSGSPLGMAYTTAMGAAGAANLRTQLSGQMTVGVNLPVFLIESAQILLILPQVLKAASGIASSLGTKLSKEIGYGANGPVGFTRRARTFLKESANVHLLNSFGVQPLIQDIKTMWNITTTTHEHLKRLQKLDEQTWSSFSAGYSPAEPLTLTPFSAMRKASTQGITQDIIAKELRCRVHAHIRKNGPLPQDTISQLTRQYTGFRSPFTTLWELCPFSFALDWVYSVGDLAQNLDSKLQQFGEEPFLQTRRLCWTSQAYAVRRFKATKILGIPGDYELGTLIQSEFRRGLNLPIYAGESASLQNIGMRQVGLSTSLILQRVA